MRKLDQIDRKIIEILIEDAAQTNLAIGKKVGLSEPAVRRRISNLVKDGVIRRFTIEVGEGGGVQALVFLSASTHEPSEKLIKSLSKEEGIGFIWETSGEMDIALTISASSMEELNKRVDRIRALPSVKKTKTYVIMKRWR